MPYSRDSTEHLEHPEGFSNRLDFQMLSDSDAGYMKCRSEKGPDVFAFDSTQLKQPFDDVRVRGCFPPEAVGP